MDSRISTLFLKYIEKTRRLINYLPTMIVLALWNYG